MQPVREWGLSPRASLSLNPGGGCSARPVLGARPHAPALLGVGVADRSPRVGSWPCVGREFGAEGEREGGKPLCDSQVAVAGARISNLFLSREGKSWERWDRGRANRSPHGGTETPRVKKGQCAGWRGAPAPVACGQRQAGCGWERRPAWRRVSAVRKRSFLFFPFAVVRLGHAFFIFGRLG